jgi:hypothetical protein
MSGPISHFLDTFKLTGLKDEISLAVGGSVDSKGETLVTVVCNSVAGSETLAATVSVCAVVLVLPSLAVLSEEKLR